MQFSYAARKGKNAEEGIGLTAVFSGCIVNSAVTVAFAESYLMICFPWRRAIA